MTFFFSSFFFFLFPHFSLYTFKNHHGTTDAGSKQCFSHDLIFLHKVREPSGGLWMSVNTVKYSRGETVTLQCYWLRTPPAKYLRTCYNDRCALSTDTTVRLNAGNIHALSSNILWLLLMTQNIYACNFTATVNILRLFCNSKDSLGSFASGCNDIMLRYKGEIERSGTYLSDSHKNKIILWLLRCYEIVWLKGIYYLTHLSTYLY